MKAYAKLYIPGEEPRRIEYLIDEPDFVRVRGRSVWVNTDPVGYLRMGVGDAKHLLHRWLLGLEIGDSRVGDHVNKNVLDNRRDNLRILSATESNYNRRPWNSAGLPTGVQRMPSGRYQVGVTYRGKRYGLGTHDTPEQAAARREEFISKITRA